VSYLEWTLPPKCFLSEQFDEEKFYAKIAGTNEEEVDIKSWVAEENEQPLMMIDEEEEQKEEKRGKKLGLLTDEPSPYSYLPVKSQEKVVLYGSEHLYTLSRFIYALY
jgi:hypothetical protein